LAKTRRVLETSDNHKKVATEVATLDGHPLTDQRMPSLANAKFKNIFGLLRQFLLRFVLYSAIIF
jgi:hypothetical protein